MTYNHLALFTCVIFLIIGIVVRYKIGKRRFNRRNFAGIQVFKSYRRGLIIRILEGFGMIASLFLIFMGLAGILIFSFRH